MVDCPKELFEWTIDTPPPEVALEGCEGVVRVSVPVHRFGQSRFTLDVTGGTPLLRRIFEFYNADALTAAQLDDVEDDCMGLKAACVRKMARGGRVRAIELMGDYVYFEGLRRSGDTAKLVLGS